MNPNHLIQIFINLYSKKLTENFGLRAFLEPTLRIFLQNILLNLELPVYSCKTFSLDKNLYFPIFLCVLKNLGSYFSCTSYVWRKYTLTNLPLHTFSNAYTLIHKNFYNVSFHFQIFVLADDPNFIIPPTFLTTSFY